MHAGSDLSAYIDGELAPAERARVEGHLAGCSLCRAQLAELRAVASLVAALPDVRPSRSLVPAFTPRYAWARAVRSLSAFASGAFLFAFLVTAVARGGSGLGGGSPTQLIPAPPFGAAAPAQPAASAAYAPEPRPTAAPAAAPQAQKEGATAASDRSLGVAQRESARAPAPLTEPLLWLALAVSAGLIAIAAHRRLGTR